MNEITITDIDVVTLSSQSFATEYAEFLSSGHADAKLVFAQWEGWLETLDSSLLRAYARRAFEREFAFLTSN